MSTPFVDTDVIIRLLTGDDPRKQAEAAELFEAVESGKIVLQAPDTVIADAVYVLSSRRLYNVPRSEVRNLLAALTRLPNFRVQNRRAVLAALDLYAGTRLDFGDALIAAAMAQQGEETLYSYDTDFDRLDAVTRRSPAEIPQLE